jgi:catechol-2,3-dioxygenase
MHIRELRLMTHCLRQQKEFYTHTLGLEILDDTEFSVTLSAGETRLVFLQSETETHPFYHFAFNIPCNKFTLGKAWLALCCPLLEKDGVNQITHKAWNAQSVYFYDPAGNIVELIARYNLKNDSEGIFSAYDLLCVSEIGLVVNDVLSTAESLGSSLGKKIWKEQSDTFTAMGDDSGLFILAKLGRIWLLTDKPAEVYPVTMTIQGSAPLYYQIPQFPYQINVQ